MKRVFCLLFSFFILVFPALAVDVSDYYRFDPLLPVWDIDLQQIPGAFSLDDSSRAAASHPMTGVSYVRGRFGSVSGYLYLPSNYRSGVFGLSGQYLFNTTSGSITGLFYADSGSVYDISFSGFSTGRYRLENSSSSWSYLYLIPDFQDTNMVIAQSNSMPLSLTEFMLLLILVFVGVKCVVD